ncbi:8-amino-7-oxononanoate synthase [Leucogyrophana mollusca]|uniref:8-amino-7-oxononanoate synthase n=1 Tax=Leucogyrophana mollusca TaxID=85980 RepID=A0ACB8B8M9_9AGAM|nr:8-amino-7-oxononanoate synthase [Leucogyrophana mollusca]
MSADTPLLNALQQALADRADTGMYIFDITEPLPSSAPDLFSNDYLSLTTDPVAREYLVARIANNPCLFGSTGSRLATGNSDDYNALERRLQHHYHAPAALLTNTGFTANLAFWGSVPQPNDIIIYDDLIHMSCREGFRLAQAEASYRFDHNSVSSFHAVLVDALKKHPKIVSGNATVFISVESLYSMDGDFCPLREIVELVEKLVPSGHAHIAVDEAHTTAMYGPDGSGFVAHLGLNDRVHTTMHTFGKAVGLQGGVILTSPTIRQYLINFARSFMFATSMPHISIHAANSLFDVIMSERGNQLRKQLRANCLYAYAALSTAFKRVPKDVLRLEDNPMYEGATELCSPIIPIFSTLANDLSDFLRPRGYAATPFTYPVVRDPRIRLIIHARNTKEDIDGFVTLLMQWASGKRPVARL